MNKFLLFIYITVLCFLILILGAGSAHASGKGWTQPETVRIEAYPNPFNEAFKVVFMSKTECDYKIEMTDITGRVVYSDKFTARPGEVIKPIGMLSEFPHGNYLITVSNGIDEPMKIKMQH